MIHDSIGLPPAAVMDEVIQQARDTFIEIAEFDYLNKILIENGLDPAEHGITTFGDYNPEDSRYAQYMIC